MSRWTRGKITKQMSQKEMADDLQKRAERIEDAAEDLLADGEDVEKAQVYATLAVAARLEELSFTTAHA